MQRTIGWDIIIILCESNRNKIYEQSQNRKNKIRFYGLW